MSAAIIKVWNPTSTILSNSSGFINSNNSTQNKLRTPLRPLQEIYWEQEALRSELFICSARRLQTVVVSIFKSKILLHN